MEKLAAVVTEGDSKRDKSSSTDTSTGGPPSGRVPWVAVFVLFSLSSWGFIGWRHFDLEWKVDRLEGELEARLEHRLQQLGLNQPTPPATHTRVVRDVSMDNCICQAGQELFCTSY